MKKRLSVRELKDYFSQTKPIEISFSTENQPWYHASAPCKAWCKFPTVTVCENPNLIYLQSSGSTLCFDQVQYAEVDTDATVLGTVLRIFCGNTVGGADTNTSYILVVS